jgi:hypothetical protein
LYLIWDGLDVWIAHSRGLHDWCKDSRRSMKVTVAFTAIIGVGEWWGWASHVDRPRSVVAFDVVAIAILFAYRAAGELAREAAAHSLRYALTGGWVKRQPSP